MTPEQIERLKERRNEIITVAMGKCWHKWIVNPPLWDVKHNTVTPHYHCILCNNDSINTNNPDYSTPEGWFELYNWLTKEKPEWWEDFYWWSWRYRIKLYNIEHINSENHNFTVYLISNLSDLFVQWLAETETGWWEKSYCPHCNKNGVQMHWTHPCENCGSIGGKGLTPLGKLMKEVLDERRQTMETNSLYSNCPVCGEEGEKLRDWVHQTGDISTLRDVVLGSKHIYACPKCHCLFWEEV